MTRPIAAPLAAALLCLAAPAAADEALRPALPEPFLFAQGFAPGGQRPFAGDIDGDGFAELITVPEDGTIWICRNEQGQRIHGIERWCAGGFFTIPVWDPPEAWKDSICIAPNADGICDSGLRDWNDWEIITSVGLERSILQSWTPRGRR